jgi:hypothetical protein
MDEKKCSDLSFKQRRLEGKCVDANRSFSRSASLVAMVLGLTILPICHTRAGHVLGTVMSDMIKNYSCTLVRLVYRTLAYSTIFTLAGLLTVLLSSAFDW